MRRLFDFDGVVLTVSFYESEYLSQLCRLVPSQKRKLLFLFWNIGPESALSSVRAFVAEMGFALPMRHKLPQFLTNKMPPGGKRVARLSDWLPLVTHPRAFGCWLDDRGGGG